VIAEIENASQRAALLQAEGALEAARAAERKTTGGLRSEQISIRETGLESAKRGAVTALLSAYAAIDSAVDDTADQLFSGVELGTPDLIFFSTNNQREVELERIRRVLASTLTRTASVSQTITVADDLEAEMARTEEEVRAARSFIDTLVAALNDAIPSSDFSVDTILAYKASVGAERTALTSALSSIALARASLATAKKTLEEGEGFSQETDLAGASAAVKQAQGAYASALAAYQKTVVRSSLTGSVLSCSVKMGDIVSFGADVCRIAGTPTASSSSFDLPLSAVKYTPLGAFVFVLEQTNRVRALEVETGLVTAGGILVTGLTGEEFIVRDVRGLVDGEEVALSQS
jgi:multidrug resistance efflux pump